MTKWRLGKHDDARRLLREIQPSIDKYLGAPALGWLDPVAIEVLRREAETLIGQERADEAKQTDNPTDKPTKK
jgi:hypothetical protein